ncbi:MAG TPA: ABC transporter permease [Gaiellaceae bacterium]|nr:ABC transporter permease [Gaiellaceae bacterium]HUJ54673.1 ABC transporter permease [Gaiellaceae bacterium]
MSVALRSRLAPYLLGMPAGAYLAIFFIVPLFAVLSISLETGNYDTGFVLTWHWHEYVTAIREYHTQFIRSFEYAALSTVLALVLAYPISYWIAFHGGRHKSTYLLLLLLPFFVSFLIRTLAWQFILSDQGIVLGTLKNWHLLPQSLRVLSTPSAVIAGLTYNALPFMALPLYVGLERIDRRLVQAAGDLYARPATSFLRVIVPLSAPGIFAGFLLVFVTNVGDYVNATILGGPDTTMIGNIIQTEYLTNFDYPMAAALSSLLIGGTLIVIFLYARTFGASQIQEYA